MLQRGYHIQLQVFSTIFANFLNVTYGLSIGWFIIYRDKFRAEANPLEVPPLSFSEIKWIDLSLYGGALMGIIILTLTGDIVGRKYTLLAISIPQAFAWLLKMQSTNATELYLGRFLTGFTAGGSINLIVLYVAELADNRIRGRLGTILTVSINAGTLLMLIADLFLSYLEVAYITFVFLFLFLCTFNIFPDTPRQLYKTRRKEEAIISLQLYRDIRDLECQTDDCYKIEVKNIREILKSDAGLTLTNIWTATIKSLTISLLLTILNVSVNGFLMLNLTNCRLSHANEIDVQIFRIVIVICQLVGSIVCLTIVDFIERKSLLLASVTGIIVSQILYGSIELKILNNENVIVATFALAALSLHMGVYPLTFVLIPEIIPEKIRIYGVTCVYTGYWLLTMGFSMSEWTFSGSFHHTNWPIFITFLIFNVICLLVFWALIPSTKQRSYKDIFDKLNYEINS